MMKCIKGVVSGRQEPSQGLPVGASRVWRGDGAAERAGLENRRPRKGSASSNLAPSAIFSPNAGALLPSVSENLIVHSDGTLLRLMAVALCVDRIHFH